MSLDTIVIDYSDILIDTDQDGFPDNDPVDDFSYLYPLNWSPSTDTTTNIQHDTLVLIKTEYVEPPLKWDFFFFTEIGFFILGFTAGMIARAINKAGT